MTPSDPAGATLAYERLRAAIVEQRYAAGQRLVEQQLASELDLSRTPVREALRRLEAEGFVVSERNRGAVVRSISLDEVADLYELRARLESYAAELAAERAEPDDLGAIRAGVEEFSAACAAIDGEQAGLDAIRTLSSANSAIHEAIVGAAHHARLSTMLTRTVDIPLVFRSFRTFGRQERERSDLFHQLIAGAIESGSGMRAARLMEEHIRQGLDAILTTLDPTPAIGN